LHIAKANGSSLTFGRIFFLIIKELKLDNFRSFSHARLDFVPGQNYIFGQNWQGKSSIVDAIGFALFGVAIFPKKVAGTAVTSDHLVNEASKHGAVELRFEQDGFEYSIHRSLPGGRVSLKQSDAEIAVGIRTVAEKLVALLGVDVKLFQNIFFSDQDDLRKSLEFSPEDRRVFIERLLGVEEWKQRIESLRATRKALEEFLSDLTSGRLGAFLTHIEELESEVDSGQEELNNLQSSLREAQKNSPRNIEKLRAEQTRYENAVAVLQHKQLQFETRISFEERIRDSIRKGKCPTCTQKIPPALGKSRLGALDHALKEMGKQLAKIERDLLKAESALEERGYDESFDAFVDLKETRATFVATAKRVKSDEQRLKKLRSQARTFGKKPEQVERTKVELEFLNTLVEAIQQFRKSLRKRLVGQLEIGTNDLLARFHDGDNDSVVKIDHDLNIAVQLHGRDVPIFNLSGAAKDILALALRYGLLRIAAGSINFFVLDEPTRHMDSENCQRLKVLFNDLLDRQLIIVTVNSEFSDAVGRHFRVAKDETFRSVVSESW
jgi:exonuclease SbcC